MCIFAKVFKGNNLKSMWLVAVLTTLLISLRLDCINSLAITNNYLSRNFGLSKVNEPSNFRPSFLAATSTESTPLPWEKSVKLNRELTYMPFLNKQLELIKNLGFEKVDLKPEVSFRSSTVKPAKIGNLCFKGGIFRKIRMTYFDAGDGVQVYNTLWYPDYFYDLPLLGIDLISLGLNRVLTVIDFQPLHPTDEYSNKYISHLKPIRDKYSDLQGILSGKIYNDTSFFSKQMLFGRFTDETKIKNVVYPAHDAYLNAYLKLAEKAVPNKDLSAMQTVALRQKEYDTYSALKDPAVGLFDAYFGKEWSNSFVHDFLFDLSSNKVSAGPIP